MSLLPRRSNSVTPKCFSRPRTCCVMAGCDMPSRRAAREKLPASKTALTARIRELVSDIRRPPMSHSSGCGVVTKPGLAGQYKL